jgi:hypothetical protein
VSPDRRHLDQTVLPCRENQSPAGNDLSVCVDHAGVTIGPNGALEPVRGLANKLPEHAARLAAILALVDESSP